MPGGPTPHHDIDPTTPMEVDQTEGRAAAGLQPDLSNHLDHLIREMDAIDGAAQQANREPELLTENASSGQSIFVAASPEEPRHRSGGGDAEGHRDGRARSPADDAWYRQTPKGAREMAREIGGRGRSQSPRHSNLDL